MSHKLLTASLHHCDFEIKEAVKFKIVTQKENEGKKNEIVKKKIKIHSCFWKPEQGRLTFLLKLIFVIKKKNKILNQLQISARINKLYYQ